MTFEHDAVVATLAERASKQVNAGLTALHVGKIIEAEVHLRAAYATLSSLQALLDGTAPAKPMRKLAVVHLPPQAGEEGLPDWFHRKANSEDPDGSAA